MGCYDWSEESCHWLLPDKNSVLKMHKLVPDYRADPVPLARRRWFRIAIVIIGLVVLGCTSFWLWNLAVNSYWEHRALIYRDDPTRVVYEDDPRTALALIAKSDRYRVPTIRDSRGLHDKNAQLPVAYHPEIGDMSFGPWAYLLLHGRRAGHGQRLVVVMLKIDEISDSQRMLAIAAFSSLPSREDPVVGNSATGTGGFFVRLKRDDHLRIFAGQPSDDDDSRFDIRFELNNAPGKLTGQLQNNGEVRISLEEGQLEILRTREEAESGTVH